MIVRPLTFLCAVALSSVDGFAIVTHPLTRSKPGASFAPALFMSDSTLGEAAQEPTMITPVQSFGDQTNGPTLNLADLISQQLLQVDWNEVINTSIIALAACAVVYKLTIVNAGVSRGWNAEEMAARVAADMWSSYLSVLRNNPIATKAVTSGTVYTIGDIIAQRTEGASMGTLDRPRVVRSMLAGFIGHGPMSHFWYQVSENFFVNVLQVTQWWSFVPKIVIDQTVWGPIWNNSYIIFLGLMKLESPGTIWGDMKRTTIPLIVSGLKLWPLAHCVTYGLIPVENRLLWVDMVEILWVTILATQAAGGGHAAEKGVAENEKSL